MRWLLILLLSVGSCFGQTTWGGAAGGGTHTYGGWDFGTVQLPQNWVNNLEYQTATSNTATWPNAWTCSGTGYGPYTPTGTQQQNMAALRAMVNDAETCRTTNPAHPGTLIIIPHGTVFSDATGLVLPQTAGDTYSTFIVLNSDTPLQVGRVPCSHGIQDNIPQSSQPGIRNFGCNGQNMSYQLGVDVYNTAGVSGGPPTTGSFTLANGTPTNTAAYNDIASMYTLESTQTNGSAILTANWDANNVGPHHFAILNAEVRMGAGLWQVASPIKIGQGGEFMVSQLPTHMHFAYLYVHADWGDAPVTGAGANAVATSSPQGANQNPNDIVFQACVYCSITYNYHDKTLRPGQEGHIVAFNYVHQIKLVHNWFEGQSIGHMCGGAGGPVSLNPWQNGVIVPANIFVECQDMEDRANRWTYPYSWMLAGNVPGPIGPFRPASSMSTTDVTNPPPAGGQGLVLNLQGARAGAVFGVVVQNGGFGYQLNDLVTAQQTGLGSNAQFLVTGVSGGAVNAVATAPGTGGYTVANNLPVSGTGGMQVNITSVGPSGRPTGVSLGTNPGSGYTNASIVTITQAGGSGGTVQPVSVTTVASGIAIQAGGTGYSTTTTPAATSAQNGGSGMTVNITSVSGGAITGVTIAATGGGYTMASVITVAGGTGGVVVPTAITSGVPTAINLVTGTGYQVNSFGRKNAHEYKWSDRVILDGNIFENVDYTGAQGTSVSFKVNQTSASNPGTNYWTQQTNTTMTNNIVRNGCNGTSMGFRSNPSAGGGVAQRADYYVYTNNLVYNISMGGSTVNPGCQQSPGPYNLRVASATNGTTWGQVQSSPTQVPATYPADVVTVSRDSTGQIATLVLGGWGQGYTAGPAVLTTSAVGSGSSASTSGSGLTISVTSVDSLGQITGVNIVSQGNGYASGDGVTVQAPAGVTIPAALSILQNGGTGSTGPALGVALGIPNKGISGFFPGDVINVHCPDSSFNVPTSTAWPVPTTNLPTPLIGAKVTSSQVFGTIVSYPNPGTPGATSSGCYVSNVQGDPSYLYANHNSHFMRLYTGQKTGDPGSDNLGGSGNFCGMAMGISFMNTISLGGGAVASALGEGTRTTQCAFDGGQPGSVLNYHHVTVPGRATAVTCPSLSGMACYTEYNNGTPLTPPATIWGTLTPYCQGTNPATEDCQGVVGNMGVGSTGTFNYALPNWFDYRLCHTTDPVSQCGGVASVYAAGGTKAPTDGKDLGADFNAINAAQTSTQFPAPGSYRDY